jgi:TolB protein
MNVKKMNGGINMQLFYTVRPGETLSQIAKRWELPVESLIAANNLAPPYTIFVGQQLSVPPGVDVVRIKQGDTVYKLSQNFGVPQGFIIHANQLQPPYVLQIGQLLTIPPGVPYYVVQPGDTLYQIARRFNVVTGGRSNFELMKEVNRLTSDVIYPGMNLIIPYAPPGEDGLIAYTSNRGGEYDVWIFHPNHGLSQQITFGLGESFSIPFWSPDSKKIAFVGKKAILYVVDVAENTIARIDQFADGLGAFLNWSPDSQKLVYTKPNGIVLYNVSTHQAQILNQPGATDAQWFPNGVELLFQAADEAGVSQLFRIAADGTVKRQITQNNGGGLNTVRLSPDGSFVLYTTPGASISIIFTVELATGRVFEVRGGPLAKNYYPVWSPNSSTIAYSATAFEDLGYFSFIRTSDKQGGNDVTRAISECFATPISWSPDGREIAYLSGCKNQGAASEIWLLDINHPVPIRLVEGGNITALQWSPLATSFLKETYRNAEFHVQFQYPSNWEEEGRYEGPDGFFQISALASNEEIDTVCQNEASHQLLPYGTEPRIVKTQIQNQEACFIHPSQDQPAEMRGQSALIVKYPTPVVIDGTRYHYFILWADKDHIDEIGRSVTFL